MREADQQLAKVESDREQRAKAAVDDGNIGGDVYTAYTFIAVPALVCATGAAGFYALSYTIMVFPVVFIFAPRLWSVARARGYVSPGEFVRGRHGS